MKIPVKESYGYEVVESAAGDLRWVATEHNGLKYWSIISPSDILGNRYGRNTFKDCLDRMNQRALQRIDAHIKMCELLRLPKLQGEIWEGFGSLKDKDYCYIDVSYFDNYENWCRVGNTTQEQYQQFRKFLKEKQNES